MFLPFLIGKNVSTKTLAEGTPWDFAPAPERLAEMRSHKKDSRRKIMLHPATDWNVYTSIIPVIKHERCGSGNEPRGLRGIVADYDAVMDIDAALPFINQMREAFQPQFYEVSLGKKARLIWIFERELPVPGLSYCKDLLDKFFERMGVETVLPGFDPCSSKPTEVWTNGGVWYELKKTPLSAEVIRGVAADAAKKTSLFGKSDIPMVRVAEEVTRRWPGRWNGEFSEGKLGVRFWDEVADCPTGCQVKPEGMLCFTGRQPFVSWAELFGHSWCEEQKIVNIGKASEDILFDGRNYWERSGDRWVPRSRQSALLILKERGMSDKAPKGVSISEAEKVLRYIEREDGGWVDGAASLVNHRPGIVHISGKKVLNISTFRPLSPASEIAGIPETDFPFIWKFLNGYFAKPELRPLDHFLGWTQRFYRSLVDYKPELGQAHFHCGPHGNGKTLLCTRIIGGLCGDRFSTPMDYFYGLTNFNDEIFESPLIAVNDEDAPTTEGSKSKFASQLRSWTVNPFHTYHPKFCQKVTVQWIGRLFFTLNDDAQSVGLLPEVNENTFHKMSFYASQPFVGKWPVDTEGTIRTELPKFACWLLDVYKLPEDVVSDDPRIGVKSFYDPIILDLSKQQVIAYNLVELLRIWVQIDDETMKTGQWIGTPTDLIARLSLCQQLVTLIRDWSVVRMAKSLTTLARTLHTGIEYCGEGQRVFKIDAKTLLREEGK